MLGKWDGKPRVGGSTSDAYSICISKEGRESRRWEWSGGLEAEGNPFGAAHSGEGLRSSRHSTAAGKTRLPFHPSGEELGPEHVMPGAPTFTQGRSLVYSRFHGFATSAPNNSAQCFSAQGAHSIPNVSLWSSREAYFGNINLKGVFAHKKDGGT